MELQVQQRLLVAQAVQVAVHHTISAADHLLQVARQLQVKEKQAVQERPTVQHTEQQVAAVALPLQAPPELQTEAMIAAQAAMDPAHMIRGAMQHRQAKI